MENKIGYSLVFYVYNKCLYFVHKIWDKNEKLDHEEYILNIVHYLIDEGMKMRVLPNPPEEVGVVKNLTIGQPFPRTDTTEGGC